MTRSVKDPHWWDELTVDDACDTAAQISELLQRETLDAARIGRLWSLLFVLDQHQQMKDVVAQIRNDTPPDCGKETGRAGAWIRKYEKLIAELRNLKSALSDLPADYASLAQAVECLYDDLQACSGQIMEQTLRDARFRGRI